MGRLFADLLSDIIVAAEDDKVSEEEFQNIVTAAKQVAADVDEQTATLRKVFWLVKRILTVVGQFFWLFKNTTKGC